MNSGNNGSTIRTMMTTWITRDRAWTFENCLFFDQISGTSTGSLVTCNGGSFFGAMVSRILPQNVANQPLDCTSRSESTLPRASRGIGRKKYSLKLSENDEPKPWEANALGSLPRGIFTGRSVRKSFRLDQKFFSPD